MAVRVRPISIKTSHVTVFCSSAHRRNAGRSSGCLRYFTFYFLGAFTNHEASDTMVAQVTDLRCLAIDLGPLRS